MDKVDKQILHEGKFLRLVKEGRWEYAERTNASGAAIIAAVTKNHELVLVEQYRVPLQARTIELPAGLIGDEPGSGSEIWMDAARRELLEETGYEAETLTLLTQGPTSAGLTSEVVAFYLASNIQKVGLGGGVDKEDIIVHAVPISEIPNWLQAQAETGILIDPKVYAGLYFTSRMR